MPSIPPGSGSPTRLYTSESDIVPSKGGQTGAVSTLYLYDSSLSPLSRATTGLSLIVTDPVGTTVATPTLGPLAVGFGATIADPNRHDLSIRDRSGTYAAAHVVQLNGAAGYRVDLVLLPLPVTMGSGRVSAGGLRAVRTYVEEQVADGIWSELEAAGVALTVAVAQHARSKPRPDRKLRDFLEGLSKKLESLGIDDA